MKKILILLLALFSLEGFSANYEIVKNPSVKISKQDIQKNNKSIEMAIKEEYAWNSESDLLVSRRIENAEEGSLEVFYTVEKKNNKWTVIERHTRVN